MQKINAHRVGAALPAQNSLDLLHLAQAAIAYAQAVAVTGHCKDVLKAGFLAWRTEADNHECIKRGSVEWAAMMAATADEYRRLRNAKSREYRAQKKLLALAKQWEGAR
ncbi:MAG: hypothetical protein JSR53_16600 [Proteobacteria bacterium]|nr:hypothetical protein [Pseudomonadota bacterium]